MSSVTEIIEHLTEGDDDFSVKDVAHDPSPRIVLRVREPYDHVSFDAFVEDKWIGRVGKISDVGAPGGRIWPDPKGNKWAANWLPEVDAHPRPETFDTALQAAQWLWDHRQYQSMFKTESEDFSIKDATPERQPEFSFQMHRTNAGLDSVSCNVFVDGHFIGRLLRDYDPTKWLPDWTKTHPNHERPGSFNSKEEAATWLWTMHQLKASKIVNQVIESDEGVSAPSPVKLAATDLMDAGFNVTKAEDHENGWLLECNWLAPSNKTFIVGTQRIKEVVGKHLKESVASTRRNGQKMEIRLWHTSQKEN